MLSFFVCLESVRSFGTRWYKFYLPRNSHRLLAVLLFIRRRFLLLELRCRHYMLTVRLLCKGFMSEMDTSRSLRCRGITLERQT